MTSTKNQYYGTICVNFLTLAYGIATAWTSPAIPILQSAETPLACGPITDSEASIIGSITMLGGLVGTLFFGWAGNEFGRRVLLFMALPQILAWILVYFAESAALLILFRFLTGVAGGGLFNVIPAYVTEISEDRIRGRLGAFLVLFFGLGMFFGYSYGTVFPYSWTPWLSIPPTIIFIIGFVSLPETPFFLMKSRQYEEAERSLRFYRCERENTSDGNMDLKIELQAIKASLEGRSDERLSCSDFKTLHFRKAIIFGVCLMAINQFTGVFPMLNFMATIFDQSGSTLSPNISSIIVGIIQIIGALFPPLLVERLGRRMMLFISALGCAIGLSVISIYTLLISLGHDLSSFGWIPLAAFSFVIFIANWGVLTLPFLVLSEIVPAKTKGFTVMFCMGCMYIFSFLVIELLSTLIDVFGIHGTMALFGVFSLLSAVFVIYFLPETKGKSYEEIAEVMG